MEKMISRIRGAIARGWCTKRNELKEMDVDLAEDVSQEVLELFNNEIESLQQRIKELEGNISWPDVCYVKLGFFRDIMTPEDVKVVQNFIDLTLNKEK